MPLDMLQLDNGLDAHRCIVDASIVVLACLHKLSASALFQSHRQWSRTLRFVAWDGSADEAMQVLWRMAMFVQLITNIYQGDTGIVSTMKS